MAPATNRFMMHPTRLGNSLVSATAVKQAVFPFDRFPEEDPVLGPEMRSTGEVMGIDTDFGRAFAKAQLAAGMAIPKPGPGAGRVFISVHDRDKPAAARIARRLHTLGFRCCATRGTAEALQAAGVPCEQIQKIAAGSPNVLDLLADEADPVVLMINTPLGEPEYPATPGHPTGGSLE